MGFSSGLVQAFHEGLRDVARIKGRACSTSGLSHIALLRKLIVLTAGTYVNVIRIIPPLVTTADEVDQALSILDESLAAAGA